MLLCIHNLIIMATYKEIQVVDKISQIFGIWL